MLPYAPESLPHLKGRLGKAWQPIYDVRLVAEGKQAMPSTRRRHVLDCLDGLRLIASQDRQEDGRLVYHLSASLWPGTPAYQQVWHELNAITREVELEDVKRAFVRLTEERWQLLDGPPVHLTLFSEGKGVPHWFGEVTRGA